MTAKELKENAESIFYRDILGGNDLICKPVGREMVKVYKFTEPEFKVFIDQLCKEQREICADHIAVWNDAETNAELILNAKQPAI